MSQVTGVVSRPPAATLEPAQYLRAQTRRSRRRTARRIGLGLVLLAIWEVAGQLSSPLFLASASDTAVALVGLFQDPRLFNAIVTSAQALVLGYALSAVAGVSLGFLMARFRRVEASLNPYLTIVLATPLVALIPVFIIIFGLSLAARVAVVFTFSFVDITVNTFTGAKGVPREVREMASSYGFSETLTYRHVIIPSAGPMIFTGLRLGFARAILGMLLSEVLLLAVGLGGLLLEFANQFNTAGVFSVIAIILAISVGVTSVIEGLDHRLNRWRYGRG